MPSRVGAAGSGSVTWPDSREAIADVAVLGVPDEEMGQRVHAVVEPAVPGAGGPALEAELIAFCRSRIAHYKAPRTVSFDAALPRTPSGKMLRRVLAERLRP